MKTGVTSNLKDLIGDIGRVKEELKAPNNPLDEYMLHLGMQIVSQLKQSLRESGIDQNSLLSQSVNSTIVNDDNGITLTITADDYWKFVNDGVNGIRRNVGSEMSFKTPYPSKKMAKSIQGWASRKSIGSAKDVKSISYAIATKVKREGIDPTYFVDKVLTEDFISIIEKELASEFKKTLTLTIT